MRLEMKEIGEEGEDGEKRVIKTDGGVAGRLEKVLPLQGVFSYIHFNYSNRGGLLMLLDEGNSERVGENWGLVRTLHSGNREERAGDR